MVHPSKVGLVFGTLAGGVHLVWSVFVVIGWGQSLVDFILWAHMMHLAIIIGPFDVTASVTLVIVTALIGYLVGFVGAKVWNKVHSR